MRRRLIVGFPHDDDVVDYLQTPAGGGLPATDAQRVASALGGQLKDVRAVADAAARRRRRDASVGADAGCIARGFGGKVVRQWEALADAGNATELPRGQRVALYKRALRFWAMAETLSARRDMPRRELAASVFAPTGGAAAAEIEENIALGLLAYVPLGRCGGAGAEDDRDIGIAAASPRLRAPRSARSPADARCKAYRDKLSGELAKLEQQQRMAQLSERRLELAAERRGTASALAATPAEDGALSAALLKAAAAGEAEREEITAELKRVRDEFDALKWKGRWSG